MSSRVGEEVLADVAARVLEDVAFVFTDRAAGPRSWPPSAVEATLAYAGPERGELRLMTSPALAAQLAANMLGVELDDPEVAERARDAVGEVLNVIAGTLMARVFGTGVVCCLGVPRISGARPGDAQGASCSIDLVTEESEPLGLWIVEGEG